MRVRFARACAAAAAGASVRDGVDRGTMSVSSLFPGGMTAQQRYEFDLNGYFVIRNAVPREQVLEARAALDEGVPFVYTADPRLGILAFNRVAWPVVMELSGGGPMIRIGSGIHNPAYDGSGRGGGGPLHCNREHQRTSMSGSPSMAQYCVTRKRTIFCTDFLLFIYLDSVRPGDGGLCLVHGSHKSRFERPPGSFGTFGSNNFTIAGTGVQREGFVSAPHPTSGHNRGPAHTVNPCVEAGDIIVMSECTSHATLPWLCMEGPRRVLGLRFKPQHAHQPEDGLTEEQILQLPPEIRELRKYAAPGVTKSIATKAGPPIKLSPPDPSTQVSPAELTPPMGKPSQSGHGDLDKQIMTMIRRIPPPLLPDVDAGLSAEQRYLLDIHGFLHLKAVVSGDELGKCQAAAHQYLAAPQSQLPPGFGQASGGCWPNAHAWSPCLEHLAAHPHLLPIVLELTDGKPKLCDGSGTIYCERGECQLNSLFSSREMHGWESVMPMDSHYGRLHCGQFSIWVFLEDVRDEQSVHLVPASHRSDFDRPEGESHLSTIPGANHECT
eukprot:COSAG02_NODE_330_length_24501_cov_39.465850_19_plen_552_part_00